VPLRAEPSRPARRARGALSAAPHALHPRPQVVFVLDPVPGPVGVDGLGERVHRAPLSQPRSRYGKAARLRRGGAFFAGRGSHGQRVLMTAGGWAAAQPRERPWRPSPLRLERTLMLPPPTAELNDAELDAVAAAARSVEYTHGPWGLRYWPRSWEPIYEPVETDGQAVSIQLHRCAYVVVSKKTRHPAAACDYPGTRGELVASCPFSQRVPIRRS